MDLTGKVAIVTGASAGIGAATVKALLNLGMKVVGFARRKERIENLVENHQGKLFAVKVDMTKPEEIIDGFDWVTKNVGPIHVLVNNAGMSTAASVLTGKIEDWKKIMDTNFMSVAIACKEAVKNMKEHQIDGYIININSVIGYYDIYDPSTIMYRTSKSSLRVMTEHIRLELARMGSKIRVTNLAPGMVKTDIIESGFGKEISKITFDHVPHLFSEDIANTIIYLISTPPRINISEILVVPTGEDIINLNKHLPK